MTTRQPFVQPTCSRWPSRKTAIAQAIQTLSDVLARREISLGADHPDTRDVRGHLKQISKPAVENKG